MIMTRKQAMIGILMAPFAGSQTSKFFEKDMDIVNIKASESISFQIAETGSFDAETHFMLEVKADGRVARFTSKEVMDALGGWFEPETK